MAMLKSWTLGLLLLLTAASPASAAPGWELHPEWARAFADKGLQAGTMLIYDAQQDRYLVLDRRRAETPFAPASTFKLFNALVALETGVIKDEHETVRWDGKKRWRDEWNRDHDLASGMKFSVVWYYQEIARRIGRERMQQWIDRVGYGNRDISGEIDSFWLGKGGLRISALQQIDFLRRLADGSLPFSARSQAIVRRIAVVDTGEGYVMHAKTGWKSVEGETDLGWYVGWVERGSQRWFFAMNVDLRESAEGEQRVPVVREILSRIGVLPARGEK